MATIEVTKDNIEESISKNEMVILDLWAEWCVTPRLVSRRPVCGSGVRGPHVNTVTRRAEWLPSK